MRRRRQPRMQWLRSSVVYLVYPAGSAQSLFFRGRGYLWLPTSAKLLFAGSAEFRRDFFLRTHDLFPFVTLKV